MDYNIFDGDILNQASTSLRINDFKVKRCALKMQKRWKERKNKSLSARAQPPPTAPGRVVSGNDMRSHTVGAPAYFGESCLWVSIPVEQWSHKNAPKHMYNARCQSRGEHVCIPRSGIQ